MRASKPAKKRPPTQPMAPAPQLPKLLLGAEEAATVLSISQASLWRMLARGELPSITVGRRRLIPVAELERFVERLRGGAA